MSLSYNQTEEVRVLSKDPRYFYLVDELFPKLLSMTPSGLNWEMEMTSAKLRQHVDAFYILLKEAVKDLVEMNCEITGEPAGKAVPITDLLQLVSAFSFIESVRILRSVWQDVMDVLTLDSSSATWRKPYPNGTDFTDEWTRFRHALLTMSEEKAHV